MLPGPSRPLAPESGDAVSSEDEGNAGGRLPAGAWVAASLAKLSLVTQVIFFRPSGVSG